MENIDKILDKRVVGAQLLIYSNNKTYTHNYGFKSHQKESKVDDNTIFRIASISKVVVAMAALKLMETNQLDINEDISNIFGFQIRNPKYPTDIITTKMLMLHTSSILDGYNDDNLTHDGISLGYNGVNGKKEYVPLKDLLSNVDSKYYTDKTYGSYKPGSHFNYSNFGTGILACIIEVITKRYFNEFVETEILKPLKLDASFKALNLIKKDSLSDTFYYDEKESNFKTFKEANFFLNLSYPNFPYGNNYRGPAGGLYTSMKDLNKIMQVLLNDGMYRGIQILKKETVDLMLQMHHLETKGDYDAKGLQLKLTDSVEDILLKGHTGTAYGVRSFMFFSKEHDFGVCFIMNGGIHEEHALGFNKTQYEVLKYGINHYLERKDKTVIIKNDLTVSLNGRTIILNNAKLIEGKIHLGIIDIANILDIIPKIKDNYYYIDNTKLVPTNELFISLDFVLDKLKLQFNKENNNYKIKLK